MPRRRRLASGCAARRRLELLHIRPDDDAGPAATSHTFWYDDPWVSNDVLLALMLGLRRRSARGSNRERQPDGRALLDVSRPTTPNGLRGG